MADYDIGDAVDLTATFTNAAGTPTDPTTVTLLLLAPDGTITTYTAGVSSQISHVASSGIYVATLTLILAGRYAWRWVGTGAVQQAEEGTLWVRTSRVLA